MLSITADPATAQYRLTTNENLFLDYVQDAGLEILSERDVEFYITMGRASCTGVDRGQPLQPYINQASGTDGFAAIVPAAFAYFCPEHEEVLPEDLRVGQWERRPPAQ